MYKYSVSFRPPHRCAKTFSMGGDVTWGGVETKSRPKGGSKFSKSMSFTGLLDMPHFFHNYFMLCVFVANQLIRKNNNGGQIKPLILPRSRHWYPTTK